MPLLRPLEFGAQTWATISYLPQDNHRKSIGCTQDHAELLEVLPMSSPALIVRIGVTNIVRFYPSGRRECNGLPGERGARMPPQLESVHPTRYVRKPWRSASTDSSRVF